MNIGIRLHDTRPGTLRERLDYAREQGFTCAHIALAMTLPGFRMADAPGRLDEALASDIRRDLAETGMECAVLGCYLNLADPDTERRARTQAVYRAHLRFAPMIGARVVGTETYANPASAFAEPPARSEEAFRLFIDSLRPAVRWAEEENAVLAVEPVYHHIISTPERAERMLEEVPSEHLQIILDPVNLIGPDTAPRAEAIIGDALSRLGDRVRVLHMKDYVPAPDAVRSMACGTGVMRRELYAGLLEFAGARGLPMTLEDTVPENARQARLFLEGLAKEAKA